jgi:ribosome-associated toxin RatA of RatAB toxin-antitoxin module
MGSFDTVDSMEIQAPAQQLFDIILDYPNMHTWYPPYRVQVIGGGQVVEGARMTHELSPRGSPIKSRFTRTIDRIKPPHTIEESYVGGDLMGKGRWQFDSVSPDVTNVSFFCNVRSNRWLMHLFFLLGGKKGHNMVYQEILAALKARAESAATS